MKIVILIITAIALGNSVPLKRPQINSNVIIRQFFEMLKFYIKNGYAEEDLPIMDPYQFKHKESEIYLPNKTLSLHAAFEDGTITGLGYFELQETDFIKDEVAINLKIKFPLIIIQSERYAMEGDFYEILPISGKGKFEFEIRNLEFSGKVFLKRSDDEKSILFEKVIYPQFNVQKIYSRVEFDGNIDKIANEILSDILADYLTRFNQFIIKTNIQNIINLINPFLNNLDSWRLLTTIL